MATRPPLRSTHPYYLYECIHDQPRAIRQVLDSQGEAAKALAERIEAAQSVHLVGIGTSWHGSLVGEFLLRQVGGRHDARVWNSLEFDAYPPALNGDDLVIVMSHSGNRHYSSRALQRAKHAGAAIALVTSTTSEAQLDLVDVVLHTCYRDKSATHTISHTTAMTALMMVAVALGGHRPDAASALQQLPDAVDTALRLEPQMQHLVKQHKGARWYTFVGWGPNTFTAYEVALKINEAAYPVTTAFQLEQYLHGPFCATTEGCVVTFIAPPGPGYERALELVRANQETGANVIALVQEGDGEIASIADHAVFLPEVPEFLTPVVYLVPLHLFTYWLALEMGHNPDTFRRHEPRHAAAFQHAWV